VSQRRAPGAVKVESIFHPSDFSEASEIAFVHALKIALVTQSRLSIACHPRFEARWLEKSVGEPIARGAGHITLFRPHGVEGFVGNLPAGSMLG